MVVAGILVAALAVGSTIGVTLGRTYHDRQATTVATTTTTLDASPSLDDRSQTCTAAINVAGQQVRNLLLRDPGAEAVVAQASIAAARQQCADLLPECPTIADAYASWLDEGVAQVTAGPGATTPLGDPPILTCSVGH